MNQLQQHNYTTPKTPNTDIKLPVYHGFIYDDTHKSIASNETFVEIAEHYISNPDFILSNGIKLKEQSQKIFDLQQNMINPLLAGDGDINKINLLRSEKDGLKSKLGGFYSAIINKTVRASEPQNKLSGMMVFDYDTYTLDYTEIKNKLKEIDYVVGFFTSPSGGLKVVVSTDLVGCDVDKERFTIAYKEVYDDFVKAGIDIEFDESAKRNQFLICYFAFDENVYVNKNAIQFKTKAYTPKVFVSPVVTERTDENDSEILKALDCFPKVGVDYADKEPVIFSILNHFGQEGIAILKQHYTHHDPKKFDRQLKGYLNSVNSGATKIRGIGSLIHDAKKLGYVRDKKSPLLEFKNPVKTNNEGVVIYPDIRNEAPISIYGDMVDEIVKNEGKPTEKTTYNFKKNIEALDMLMGYYGIKFGYDMIKDVDVVDFPNNQMNYSSPTYESEVLAKLESILVTNEWPTSRASWLAENYKANSFNKLTDICKSVEWDGVDRIKQLYETLITTDDYDTWKAIAVKKWLIECVAAWDHIESYPLQASPQFGNVLVLSGKQGIKKTQWFSKLLPDALHTYFSEGGHLDTKNKDSVVKNTSYGIVELGEIESTFTRSGYSEIKAFLTSSSDRLRKAYDRRDQTKQRRTCFCGSVNDVEYLRDGTGNRRFWTILVNAIDLDNMIDIDKVQLWCQVWKLYTSGENWWLDEGGEEYNEHLKITRNHEELDPALELLENKYHIDKPNNGTFQSIADIFEMLEITPDQKMSRKINTFLVKNGFVKKRQNNKRGFKMLGRSAAVGVLMAA